MWRKQIKTPKDETKAIRRNYSKSFLFMTSAGLGVSTAFSMSVSFVFEEVTTNAIVPNDLERHLKTKGPLSEKVWLL